MPVPTATAVGVASPSVWAGDNHSRDRESHRRDGCCAPQEVPHQEGDDSRPHGEDHQVLSGAVGQPLARRLGVLGLLDEIHDLGERGVGADGGPEADAAAAVDRPAITASPRFVTGTLSPVTSASSMLVSPSMTSPSTGTLSPGRDDGVVEPHLAARDGQFFAVPDHGRLRRDEVEERCRASLVPRLERISIQCPKRTKVTSMVAAS